MGGGCEFLRFIVNVNRSDCCFRHIANILLSAADLKKSNKTNSGDVGSSALGGPVNSYQQDLVGSGVT